MLNSRLTNIRRLVQCDEAKPVCTNCGRLQLVCVYDRVAPQNRNLIPETYASPASHSETISSRSDSSKESDVSLANADSLEPPESRGRRILELKLLHDYLTRTAPTMALNSFSHLAWTEVMPKLALQSDALLYSICAVTALHEARLDGGGADSDAMVTHQRYFGMAIRAHTEEVFRLNKETLEAICLTAPVLHMCAFDMLQHRPLDPYEPPLRWLQVFNTSYEIWRRVRKILQEDKNYFVSEWANTVPHPFNDEAFMTDEYCRALRHLLHRTQDDILNEPWNDAIEKSYQFAVGYMGSILLTLKADRLEKGGLALYGFPIRVPPEFVEALKNSQPRALVVLAHYFALLTALRRYWYIGDTGAREVRAIAKVLPPRWREHMEWPLEMAETQPFISECSTLEEEKASSRAIVSHRSNQEKNRVALSYNVSG